MATENARSKHQADLKAALGSINSKGDLTSHIERIYSALRQCQYHGVDVPQALSDHRSLPPALAKALAWVEEQGSQLDDDSAKDRAVMCCHVAEITAALMQLIASAAAGGDDVVTAKGSSRKEQADGESKAPPGRVAEILVQSRVPEKVSEATDDGAVEGCPLNRFVCVMSLLKGAASWVHLVHLYQSSEDDDDDNDDDTHMMYIWIRAIMR